MRTSRCILYTITGTILCLLYVFLQTEIVKLGYKITSAEEVLEAAVDRKTSLEYAISELASPLSLDKNPFLKKDGFQIPKNYRLVKLGPAGGGAEAVAQTETAHRRGIFSFRRYALDTLFAGRPAEAKTVK